MKTVVESAPLVIEQLSQWGVDFDLRGNEYHLTQEGGHSNRRILHVADATGKAIIEVLTQKTLDHPNIDLFEDKVAIDLAKRRNTGGQLAALGLCPQ